MLQFNQCTIATNQVLFTIDQLELLTGKLYVLVGKNGAGKSTFFRELMNQTLTGVTWNGQQLSSIPSSTFYQQFVLVNNEFRGEPFLTVREYLSFGRYPYISHFGQLSSNDWQRVDQIIEQLQLEHLSNRSTSSLSDGERQKCHIAKALVQDSTVILLDEPTSYLDYPSKIELLNLLEQLSKQHNRLIIYSSHDLEMSVQKGHSGLAITKNKTIEQLIAPYTLQTLIDTSF